MKTLYGSADTLTRTLTAFPTFTALADEAALTGYSPTLRGWSGKSRAMADTLAALFDTEMVLRGKASRAWPKR